MNTHPLVVIVSLATSLALLVTPATAAEPPPTPVRDRMITSIVGYDHGEGGPIEDASISNVHDVAVDPAGNLYFSDLTYHVIRRVDAVTDTVTTVVGSGLSGDNTADGVVPTDAAIGWPFGIALDPPGNLLFVDIVNHVVRYVNLGSDPVTAYGVVVPGGRMSTIAGDAFKGEYGEGRDGGDGGPATLASLNYPRDIALAPDGDACFDDIHNLRVRCIDRETGTITSVAGSGEWDLENSGDGGLATEASLLLPTGLAFDPAGGMVVAEWAGRIRRIDPDGTISTIAGVGVFEPDYGGDGGPATEAHLGGNPKCLVFDADGSLLFSDPEHHRVRRIDTSGIITTVVGSGFTDELWNDSAYSTLDDGAHPTAAHLRNPACMASSARGIYLADDRNHALRLLDPGDDGLLNGDTTERITDVSVNGGLKDPFRIVVERDGGIVTTQNTRARIVRVGPGDTITPLVGTGVLPNSVDGPGGDPRDDTGDGGPAIDATVSPEPGIALGPNGDLYIADTYTHRIRRVRATPALSPSSTIETVAELPFPSDELVVADHRHIYVADLSHNRVWLLDGVTGELSLLAGNGEDAVSGDGGPATAAAVGSPLGLTLDAAGRTLFVASVGTGTVRAIDLRTGTISTVAKLEYEYPWGVEKGEPVELAVLGNRFLFVTDGRFLNVFRIDLESADRTPVVVAGSGFADFPGFTGDHIAGPDSELNLPFGIAFDRAGKLYIADGQSQRIRRLGMVDILPGHFPNRIATRGAGTVPVAFLSSYDFDATTLDPATIRVAGAPVATKNGRHVTAAEDVDGDGRLDLVAHVTQASMRLVGSDVEAVVTGTTFAGRAFADADWVEVVR